LFWYVRACGSESAGEDRKRYGVAALGGAGYRQHHVKGVSEQRLQLIATTLSSSALVLHRRNPSDAQKLEENDRPDRIDA